jgi:hypothetical protein
MTVPNHYLPGLLAALALAAACAGPDASHAILAPRSVPTPRTGQPMSGMVEMGLSGGPATELAVPELGDDGAGDDQAGVHVPRVQARVDLRYRTRGIPKLELGFIHERGLRYSAYRLPENSPEIESSASSAGVSVYYPGQYFTPDFHVGWGLDTQLFLIPYVHYQECVGGDCTALYMIVDQGRTLRPVLGLSMSPSYRLPAGFALFTGFTLRNHLAMAPAGDGRVETFGAATLTTAAGLAWTHSGTGVRAAAQLYRVIGNRPVAYPAALGVALSIPLFREPGGDRGR